jgi:hypothetical protein
MTSIGASPLVFLQKKITLWSTWRMFLSRQYLQWRYIWCVMGLGREIKWDRNGLGMIYGYKVLLKFLHCHKNLYASLPCHWKLCIFLLTLVYSFCSLLCHHRDILYKINTRLPRVHRMGLCCRYHARVHKTSTSVCCSVVSARLDHARPERATVPLADLMMFVVLHTKCL